MNKRYAYLPRAYAGTTGIILNHALTHNVRFLARSLGVLLLIALLLVTGWIIVISVRLFISFALSNLGISSLTVEGRDLFSVIKPLPVIVFLLVPVADLLVSSVIKKLHPDGRWPRTAHLLFVLGFVGFVLVTASLLFSVLATRFSY